VHALVCQITYLARLFAAVKKERGREIGDNEDLGEVGRKTGEWEDVG
jgi:hypothetical protein